jgi:DNA polymerase-3 subunit beta
MNINSATSAVAASLPVALVERAALESALAFVARIPERRNYIPILSNARLRAGDGGLRIETTDMDMLACTTVPAAVDCRLDVTVPARLLHETLKGQTCELVDVRPAPYDDPYMPGGVIQSDRVALDFEGSETVLHGMPASDFPDLGAVDFSHTFALRADVLRRLLDKTAFAISTEETRYYLNGVFLHVLDSADVTRQRLRCVATDGHRLARAECQVPDGAHGMPPVIVPRKAVAEALRLIPKGTKAKPSKELVTVSVSTTRVRFSVGSSYLDSKVIDGHFPDYARVIPTGNDKRLTVHREAFAEAIKAVSAVSIEKSRAFKLSLTDGLLEVSVSNPDTGRSSRMVECEWPHPDFETAFNAKYVLDIISKLEAEHMTVMMGDPGSPALFFDGQDSSELFVCMPMRA